MRTHREPSLEGCAAKMQLGRSSFEARKSSHLRMTVIDLPCKFGVTPLRRP